jgi:hypothetical protein
VLLGFSSALRFYLFIDETAALLKSKDKKLKLLISNARNGMISFHSSPILLLLLLLFSESSFVNPFQDKQQFHQHIRNGNQQQRNIKQGNVPDNIFFQQDDFSVKSSQEKFVDDCSGYLLSKSVLGDQKVSNEEYVDFLVKSCLEQGTCQPDEDIAFGSLNSNLQSNFILSACPTNSEDAAGCYYEFKRMGADFGFLATPDTIAALDERVQSLCASTYSIIDEEGIFAQEELESVEDSDEDGKIITTPPEKPQQATAQPQIDNEQQEFIASTPAPTPGSTESSSELREHNTTDFSAFESEGTGLSTAAILGIISALSGCAFCIAVMYSGGLKEPDYDMNRPVDLHPVIYSDSKKKTDERKNHSGQRDDEDVFEDEDTGESQRRRHVGGEGDNDDVHNGAVHNYDPTRRRPHPSMPPFHPANYRTEHQKPPKFAEERNPMNLLTPNNKSWQP